MTRAPLAERIVAAALAIVAERGLAALSIRDVARRLRVSHQTPYTLFPSREHLIAELAGRAFRTFAAFLEDRPANPDARADFAELGKRYLAFAASEPLLYELMFGAPLPSAGSHPDLERDGRRAFDVLRRCVSLEAAQRGAALTIEALDRDALYVWTSMHGLAMALRPGYLATLGLRPETIAAAPLVACMRLVESLQSVPPPETQPPEAQPPEAQPPEARPRNTTHKAGSERTR